MPQTREHEHTAGASHMSLEHVTPALSDTPPTSPFGNRPAPATPTPTPTPDALPAPESWSVPLEAGADVFAAGFREALLGLWARLDRSLATSRAESGLVVVLEDDIVPEVAEVGAGLLEALLLAVLMFDGRLVTVFAPGLPEEALDAVFVVELTAGSPFAT